MGHTLVIYNLLVNCILYGHVGRHLPKSIDALEDLSVLTRADEQGKSLHRNTTLLIPMATNVKNDPNGNKSLPSLKFNTSRLKVGFPKVKVVFQPSIFGGHVSFREGSLEHITASIEPDCWSSEYLHFCHWAPNPLTHHP